MARYEPLPIYKAAMDLCVYLLARRWVVNSLKAKLEKFRGQIITTDRVAERSVTRINVGAEAVVRLRQTLASYHGHFKHADTHHLVQWIFQRFSWLNELFFIDGCHLYDRYRYGDVFHSLYDQICFYTSRLPGVILLFRAMMLLWWPRDRAEDM